jgi:glucose-6-phosphate isomerase
MDRLPPLRSRPSWRELERHRETFRGVDLAGLFARDPGRFERFSRGAAGVFVDFSKNHLTAETLALLAQLARETGVEALRDRMFAGEPINESEGRAVLHPALRDPSGRPHFVAGVDVTPTVVATLERIERLTRQVHGGGRFSDVLHLGIGGSELGPAAVVEALAAHRHGGLGIHFVANVDGHGLAPKLASLDPKRTLVLVVSKTFTTEETLRNATTVRSWLAAGGGDLATQVVAITAHPEAAVAFGIAPENVLPMWDWVGGRTSLWSAVGLPIALALGFAGFRALLDGAARMDEHFRTAPIELNLPVQLALVSIWYADFWAAESHAVLPYDARLARLPAFLQQLEMESNGKAARRDGSPAGVPTAPIVWGEPGTDGQHAFYQLLHQSERLVPCDFVLVANADHDLPGHHELLLANGLAQTQALAFGQPDEATRRALEAEGRGEEEIARLLPQRRFPGNRPSTTILLPRLDPGTVGALLALFEHQIFVEGAIWGLNSYDQWGVELGKQLARRLLPTVAGGEPLGDLDGSTRGLLAELRAQRFPDEVSR